MSIVFRDKGGCALWSDGDLRVKKSVGRTVVRDRAGFPALFPGPPGPLWSLDARAWVGVPHVSPGIEARPSADQPRKIPILGSGKRCIDLRGLRLYRYLSCARFAFRNEGRPIE